MITLLLRAGNTPEVIETSGGDWPEDLEAGTGNVFAHLLTEVTLDGRKLAAWYGDYERHGFDTVARPLMTHRPVLITSPGGLSADDVLLLCATAVVQEFGLKIPRQKELR